MPRPIDPNIGENYVSKEGVKRNKEKHKGKGKTNKEKHKNKKDT